jgi:hypothetical protein
MRLAARGEEDPPAAAERRELDDTVAAAIAQLGELYLPVVLQSQRPRQRQRVRRR